MSGVLNVRAIIAVHVKLKDPDDTLPIKVALLSSAVYSCRVKLKDPDETLPVKVTLLTPAVYPRLLELCRSEQSVRCSYRLVAPSREPDTSRWTTLGIDLVCLQLGYYRSRHVG